MQVKPCHGSQGLSSPPDTHMTWRCLPEKKVDKIKKIFVKWGFRAVICTTDILARHTRIVDRKMHKQSYHRKAEKGKVALSRVEICHCRRCNFFWQMSCLALSYDGVFWNYEPFSWQRPLPQAPGWQKIPSCCFKKWFFEWFIDKGDREYAKAFNQGQRAETCWNISTKYLKGFWIFGCMMKSI